jgi:hypothetical protein
MDDPSKKRRTIGDRIFIAFMAVILIGTPIMLFVLPDWITVQAGTKSWRLEWCGMIEHGERELFAVHLITVGGGRSPTYNWLAVLDPGSGKILGEYTSSDALGIQGFDQGRMWVREFGLGRLSDDRDFALALPNLKELKDSSRPPASKKRLSLGDCNHPKAPRKLGKKLVLDGTIVCDRRTGRAVDMGGGDRLLAHQTLQGKIGKLILTRLTKKREAVWNLAERVWAPPPEREFDQPGFRVEWATRQGRCIVLVMPLEHNEGTLVLACLDPELGLLAWRREPP